MSRNEPLRAERKLKVYSRSGYQYKPTPAIMLNGDYLKEWEFDIGSEINVVCDGYGKGTITRAEV